MERTSDDAGGAGAASGAGESLEDLLSTLSRQLRDSDWLERTPPTGERVSGIEEPDGAGQEESGAGDAAGGAAESGNRPESAFEALARALDGIARSNSGEEVSGDMQVEDSGGRRQDGGPADGVQSPPPNLGETLRTLLGDPAEHARRTGPLVEYTPQDVRD